MVREEGKEGKREGGGRGEGRKEWGRTVLCTLHDVYSTLYMYSINSTVQ